MHITALLGCLVATTALAASPAVEATLALAREAAHRKVEVALTLLDLGAAADANAVAEELKSQQLGDAALVELVQRVGSAKLVRLARSLPSVSPLVQRALDAAQAAATSPERLSELVQDLAGDRDAATAAIRELRNTGEAGVAYCVQRITEEDDAKVRARLREALVALHPASLPAIYDGLSSDSAAVRTESAYALGRLADLDRLTTPVATGLVAGPALLGDADDESSNAARWAFQQLTGRPPTMSRAVQRIDAAIEHLLAFDGGTPQATILASQLASARAQLSAGDARASDLARVLALEAGETPAQDATTHELLRSLSLSLERGWYRGGVACCEALAEQRDLSAIAGSAGRPGPLVDALEAPHPAVRFAALEAVLAINSPKPFPGSSRVRESLAYFAAATGERRAIVAMSQLARAGQIAGWLNAAGCRATPVNQGGDVVRLATESPDTELILLDVGVIRPNTRETLFRLRRTPATALTPVVLLASDRRFADALRIAEEHGGESAGVITVARPHSMDSVASLVERLEPIAPTDWPDSETRIAQATKAREAIASLLDSGPAYLGLRGLGERLVASTPYDGSPTSLETLLELGTPASQVRLLDAASLEARPLTQRKAAREAFTSSVARHGLLLTSAQIRRQYDRYNASVTAPAETQELLGRLLDTIEGAPEP